MNNEATNHGLTPEQALDKLESLFDGAVNALRAAINTYTQEGTLPVCLS